MTIKELEDKSRQLRYDTIHMISKAASGHPGGSLSCVEILVALYYSKMTIDVQKPMWEERDRFVLSKGHAAPILYTVLADKGFFPKEELNHFRQLHSILQGHPDSKKTPGVDASTGSLGQGVSIAVGMALGAKTQGKKFHVYAVLGDGELQEGQVWEAAMAAAHYKLDNLTWIIDNNGLQIDGANEEVMCLGSIKDKYESFGFKVLQVDGHNFTELLDALNEEVKGQPKCIIAETSKGKGVSFMENQAGWHGKAPSAKEAQLALKELEG